MVGLGAHGGDFPDKSADQVGAVGRLDGYGGGGFRRLREVDGDGDGGFG